MIHDTLVNELPLMQVYLLLFVRYSITKSDENYASHSLPVNMTPFSKEYEIDQWRVISGKCDSGQGQGTPL